MEPLDAGTDNGFTFTAPNWPTDPQGVIYRITSTYPAHPASSFYYPEDQRLPPIATYQFIKVSGVLLLADHTDVSAYGYVPHPDWRSIRQVSLSLIVFVS